MFEEKFEVTNFRIIKEQLLIWASHFSSCSFLDNNQYASAWQQQECLVAAGVLQAVEANPGTALLQLQEFIDAQRGKWIFGHLGYDLKDELQGLEQDIRSVAGFAGLHFYVPQNVVRLSSASLFITSYTESPAVIYEQITSILLKNTATPANADLKARVSKQQYLDTIAALKTHIHRGDCYEINYCQEFFAENASIHPVTLFKNLNTFSPNPFSCYYKSGNAHLLCASPERYMALKGNYVFSQPIKGTSPRHLNNAEEDSLRMLQLQQNKKERSENVMVVDLVRNDLSMVCSEGSVKVDELFGIYAYPQLYHMISTVSGTLVHGTSFTDIIRATFPMASMTGAPKKRVIELISIYESGKRGLFSGSVGYISPNGDFDFNVVIRSLLFNDLSKYLSYWVGSGITWYSNAEAEYEECMLKASAIKKVLQALATP